MRPKSLFSKKRKTPTQLLVSREMKWVLGNPMTGGGHSRGVERGVSHGLKSGVFRQWRRVLLHVLTGSPKKA